MLLFGFYFVITGVFVFYLFRRQVLEHTTLSAAAEKQSTTILTQPAQRGRILAEDKDARTYVLAVSEWRYQVKFAPTQVKNPDTLVKKLAEQIPELNTKLAKEQLESKKSYVPPIVTNVSATKAREIVKSNYAGVYVAPEVVRVYPEGARMAPQVIGFVGADGLGKYGIEASYEQQLRGTSGAQKAKRDSLGRLIDVLSTEKGQSGQDITLTIDYNLQYKVEKVLEEALSKFGAQSGSVLVMNPENGEILAATSLPSFDPNTYNTLSGDELRNFLLAAVSSPYEPGSIMKPITMAMALDSGAVTKDTVETFGRSVKVADHEIFNADKKVFGTQTMTQVLENSDNVGMVWVSNKLGKAAMKSYFEKFMFGKKLEIDILGEQGGIVPKDNEWSDIRVANAAFGQGVSATVLQMAAAYSAVANDGKMVRPHFVKKIGSIKSPSEEIQTVLSPQSASDVRLMLESVVINGHGKRAAVKGVRVGGKTGTAQVASPNGGYYEDKFVGSFAGMFPIEDPKFVMVVRLDNPTTVRFAESSAAPTFGEIANWICDYYGIRQ